MAKLLRSCYVVVVMMFKCPEGEFPSSLVNLIAGLSPTSSFGCYPTSHALRSVLTKNALFIFVGITYTQISSSSLISKQYENNYNTLRIKPTTLFLP